MNIKNLTHRVEKISQNYAKIFKIKRDDSWFVLKLQEEMGELTQCYLMMSGQGRHKGKQAKELKSDFEHEVADVMGQLLLLAKHFKIDLEKVVNEKWLKWENKTH
jgi:NTP pyrophosphatase (non-canonical NTP hydrolase)